MAHQHDLTSSWPPAELVEYLRAGPNEIPVSVLPRPRSELPQGLVYLMEDDGLAHLAIRAGIPMGYGGRKENDLGVAGEFSADVVAELAIGIGSGLTTQVIGALVKVVAQRLRRELRAASEHEVNAHSRVGLIRMTTDRFESVVIDGSEEEVGQRMREILERWSDDAED